MYRDYKCSKSMYGQFRMHNSTANIIVITKYSISFKKIILLCQLEESFSLEIALKKANAVF